MGWVINHVFGFQSILPVVYSGTLDNDGSCRSCSLYEYVRKYHIDLHVRPKPMSGIAGLPSESAGYTNLPDIEIQTHSRTYR